MSETSLSTSLVTGRALILLQLLSRLLTFGLNQALVRLAPPEVFGTAAIQFDLICSTILFLSREGVRNALLRASGPVAHREDDPKGRMSAREAEMKEHALATLPLYLGILISILVAGVYTYTLPDSTARQADFHLSLALYVLSALLELAIEPLHIRALRSDPPDIRTRVQAEGGMAIVKAVVTVGTVVLLDRMGKGRPLLAFALGQMAGVGWLAGRYAWKYGVRGCLWVKVPKGQKRFDVGTLSLAVANTRQSVVKHLLTEADRIAVSRICPLDEQGGYAVAMNYGSLVARIIFQPIEETLFLHFNRNLASPSTPSILHAAVHISSHFLLLLPAFLTPLLPAVLPLVLPARYRHTSAPRTLELYLEAYIPLLSLNGILEAFHTSSATPAEIAKQARWMIGSSLAFVAALLLMIRLPKGMMGKEEALLYASCLAMSVRIAYAYLHVRRFFRRPMPVREGNHAEKPDELFRLSRLAPRWPVWGMVLASGSVLRVLEKTGRWRNGWGGWAELMGTGVVLGLASLHLIYRMERKDLWLAMQTRKGKAE